MPHGSSIFHHLNIRKRIHLEKQPYPHPEKSKRTLDQVMYFFGILTPIATIPQLIQIWTDKSAGSVSIISWMTYLVAAIFWIAYGVVHQEKQIVIMYFLLLILHIGIVYGILYFG